MQILKIELLNRTIYLFRQRKKEEWEGIKKALTMESFEWEVATRHQRFFPRR